MQTIDTYRRLTHRYVGTCKDHDEHQFVATVKATPPRRTRPVGGPDRNDFSNGGAFTQHVRLPAGLDRRRRLAIARAIEDTLSAWGCSHEHDCCGCASTSASARILSPRLLLVRTHVTLNY